MINSLSVRAFERSPSLVPHRARNRRSVLPRWVPCEDEFRSSLQNPAWPERVSRRCRTSWILHCVNLFCLKGFFEQKRLKKSKKPIQADRTKKCQSDFSLEEFISRK
ncbi:MAG: hypothetical protein RLZZ46_61 [Bacteroidota bacterium]